MEIKVLQGSIKLDDRVYTVGQTLNLDEKEAKSIIREGIAEEVQEVAQPEAKRQEPEKKKAVVEKPKVEEKKIEPSMDWTAKEILDYGKSKGIEGLEMKTKQEMLDIIKGVK